MNQLLILGAALLSLGAVLLWFSGHLRRGTGLPRGKVIYTDTRTWQECPKPLYAPSINLTGKPDYLVEKWAYIIPIEVKSSQPPTEPYRSHVLQLAAYCLLVEEAYGRRPPYGLISYVGDGDIPQRTFSIPYTDELEDELLDTIEWMREDWLDQAPDRNHDDRLRCQVCGFADDCDQRLA